MNELSLEEPRTKDLAAILMMVGAGESVLIITAKRDKNIVLSCRNIPKVTTAGIRDLNAFLVVSHQRIIITREALGHLRAWMETIK